MKTFFLVFGYGIPKDILKDEKYNFYLKIAINRIFDTCVKIKTDDPLIMFCGGKSDMFKPYKRNEADEMLKLYKNLIKQNSFLRQPTKNWRTITEKTSLSTLENLINANRIITGRGTKNFRLFICCEQLRAARIKILAKKIFTKSPAPQIIPIDFDFSSSRYLSPEFIDKLEKSQLKHALWALKSPENLKKHHRVFIEKMAYLRKAGPKVHGDALKKWWEKQIKELA